MMQCSFQAFDPAHALLVVMAVFDRQLTLSPVSGRGFVLLKEDNEGGQNGKCKPLLYFYCAG